MLAGLTYDGNRVEETFRPNVRDVRQGVKKNFPPLSCPKRLLQTSIRIFHLEQKSVERLLPYIRILSGASLCVHTHAPFPPPEKFEPLEGISSPYTEMVAREATTCGLTRRHILKRLSAKNRNLLGCGPPRLALRTEADQLNFSFTLELSVTGVATGDFSEMAQASL